MGFLSHDEIEWEFSSGGVGVYIVYKFSHGDLISPIRGVASAEYLQVSFKFLINSFHFSISLRVISGGKG